MKWRWRTRLKWHGPSGAPSCLDLCHSADRQRHRRFRSSDMDCIRVPATPRTSTKHCLLISYPPRAQDVVPSLSDADGPLVGRHTADGWLHPVHPVPGGRFLARFHVSIRSSTRPRRSGRQRSRAPSQPLAAGLEAGLRVSGLVAWWLDEALETRGSSTRKA